MALSAEASTVKNLLWIVAICIVVFWLSVSISSVSLNKEVWLTFIYIVIPLIQVMVHYGLKREMLSPVWHEHVVSRIKYFLFILQSALLVLIFPSVQNLAVVSAISIFFVDLNIFLVAVDQYKQRKNPLYFVPAAYLIYCCRFSMVPVEDGYLWAANGLTAEFIVDYSLWFLMYPGIEKRLPILLHTIVPFVILSHPERWIVARSFIGSIILVLTYNKYTYSKFFDSTSQAQEIMMFQRVYTPLYVCFFICKGASRLLFD